MGFILGTSADDNMVSVDTDGDDDLRGLAGNDSISAYRSGNDILSGGDGNDELTVQRFDASAHVTLDGGLGDDHITVIGENYYQPLTVSVSGGDGADQVFLYGLGVSGSVDAGPGDDTITASVDHGGLILTLGAGADLVQLSGHPPGSMPGTSTTITDFQTGAGGDALKLVSGDSGLVFFNWDQSNPFGAGFLRLVQNGADTVLQVDYDAGGTADGFVDFVRFSNTQVGAFTAANFAGYPPNGAPTPGLVINGSSSPGHETLTGSNGADTITGLGLNDVIHAGAGDDLVYGGAGNDQIFAEAGGDTVDGGLGDDTIRGTDHALLHGGAGADLVIADATLTDVVAMTLDGGAGDDTLIGTGLHGGQQATLLGGDGRDLIYLDGPALVTADAGAGDDIFVLSTWGSPHAAVTLGPGANILQFSIYGSAPPQATVTDFDPAAGDRFRLIDYLHAANPDWNMDVNLFTAGLLRLEAQGSSTVLQVKANGHLYDAIVLENVSPADLDGRIFEGYRPDGGPNQGMVLPGGADADSLIGGVGADSLSGAAGADTLAGGRGDDTVFGGDGNDLIQETAGGNFLRGDDGDDTIQGGAGFDNVNGNRGDDLVTGGGGADWLLGGQGNDSIWGSADGGGSILNGNLGNDTVTGGRGGQFLRGGQGDDLLRGGDGDDWISGDRGDDTLSGGGGGDVFHAGQAAGSDLVLDFNAAAGDRVVLDAGMTYSIRQAGNDTVIDLGGGNQMVLHGVNADILPAGWILAP